MDRIRQSIVGNERGDCMRAVIASMMEIEIEQVPHFLLFGNKWFSCMYSFLRFMGYDVTYEHYDFDNPFTRRHLINGCIFAIVKSKSFKKTNHAVLINSVGRVIHDPNPNDGYKNENVKDGDCLRGWFKIVPRKNI